jgi:hypothetical protein
VLVQIEATGLTDTAVEDLEFVEAGGRGRCGQQQ